MATLDELIQAISDTIADCLSNAALRLQKSDRNSSELRPSFIWGQDDVMLWPFMYVTTNGEWHIYSRFRGTSPTYLSFGGDRVSATPSDEGIQAALHPLLKAKGQEDATLQYFVNDVERDLRGFADDDSELVYSDHEQGFEYYWSKATGEGTGTQPRRDYFRLGPDNARQWRAESDWVPYSEYLRVLANWQVVATRLRQKLEQIEAQLATEERETLGWAARERSTTRMARVVVSDMDGSHSEPACTFADLIDGVDEDLQANRGQTQVVFINGEAGIGKTRAMVDAAKSRARAVEQALEQGDPSDLALFLYVRSTGQVLDSLPTVVSSAVASTRNLTDAGVKALCRNGLMTLLIDGFDELLGGVGYSDAIGSLRPWLNELGGRGVVVVSARSSYYMGQYRSSVERANEQGLALVRHRIAEIQRWSHEDVVSFLDAYGVPPENLDRLSEHDRQLLGLPFFARVFAEIALAPDEIEIESDGLTERLLNKYVAREERKLMTGQTDAALLSSAELRRMFEYVAEFMASNEEREADISELEIAAESAIEEELSSPGRRHLKQRLPVLCGLTAASDDTSTSRFRFQHELFFDQFLAGAASHYLVNGQVNLFRSMLQQSHWRSATIAGVVATAGAQRTAQAISAFRPNAAGVGHRVAATNLGALWASVIRETGQMPSTDIVGAVFADDLDLSQTQFTSARMIGCELSSLALPSSPGWQLRLEETEIKKIRVIGSPSDLSGLRGVRHADLVELLLPSALLDRRDEILDALRKYGSEVADAEAQGLAGPSIDVLAARHFLSNMARRLEKSVILRRDHQPEDSRLKWPRDYGPDAWKKFVNDLDSTGLATLERFSASGEPKTRLRLRCSASTILANDGVRPGVYEYWERLEGK
ncbi:NACHT domain-containing protein [Streptomyces antibioticus]|uniref:NACHT domain-containing protein n=1 Tax=Streptomyces antibioticus TaxID=1890 RepID=UPI00367CAF44